MQELKQELKMELMLVSQSEKKTTVLFGQTPLISLNEYGSVEMGDLINAINFLRSGCPSVQFVGQIYVMEPHRIKTDLETHCKEIIEKTLLQVKSFTDLVKLENEEYELQVYSDIVDKTTSFPRIDLTILLTKT